MIKLIAKSNRKKIRLVRVFNPILRMGGSKLELINKVFGNLVYEQGMSSYKKNYQIRNLEDSIFATEN